MSKKDYLIKKIKYNNHNIPFHQFTGIKYKSINTNSWFDINKAKFKNTINIDNNKYNTVSSKISSNTIVKCRKVNILPNPKQKDILLSWFEAYRKMYNKTLTIIKLLIATDDKNKYNFMYIRTSKMKEIKKELSDKTKINSHILDGAIKLACTSYKSAMSNRKNGNIKHFRIRPIKQSKNSKILDLEKTYFNSNGFCTRILGSMLNNEDFNYKEINKDSKLHYNKITNRLTLLIPYESICNENNTAKQQFISIDPGMKIFLNGLSNNRLYNIGTNVSESIKKELTRIDKFALLNNKLGRKRILKIRANIRNKVNDLHWKSISYLLKKKCMKTIFIGNWSTKNTASNTKKLQPIYKRISSSLRFYEFLQRLQFKCNEYKSDLIITDESYTSKICSFCNGESKSYTNRKLNCGCTFNLDRDINGSINILLKNY